MRFSLYVPGKEWRWRPEPLVWVGVTLGASLGLAPWLAFIVGGAFFALLGYRLEPKTRPCPACHSPIPEDKAAELRLLLHMHGELDKLRRPPPPRPS